MVIATTLTVMAAGALPGASASGDSSIVVRGTDFPAGNRAQLSAVGCDDVFQRSAEPVRPMLGLATGPGATGERSLGFDTAGGSAVGIVGYVESIAGTSVAGLSVHAESGTTGVAYVGYQAPSDAGTSLMWIGRAALSAPASSGWTPVDVPGLGYSWTQYDLDTQRPIGGPVGSSGVPAFVQAMGGDGYGFYAVGFGCDGSPFNIDAWRIGSPGATATYDLEGYGTRTSIGGPSGPVQPGERVTLTGRVVDDLGAPASRARVVLEARQPDGTWDTVRVVVGASVAATVRVQETTTYRWTVFSTPSTEGSASEPLTVTVDRPDEKAPEPDPKATGTPAAKATEKPTEKPAAKATEKPAERPTATTTEQQPPPAVQQQTAPATEPAGPPAPEATGTPEPSSSPTSTPPAPAATEPAATASADAATSPAS